MPEPRIVEAMNKYRAALERAELASATRLIHSYGRIFQKLETELRALEADIADLGESPSVAQVRKLERFKALMNQTVEQMDKYAVLLEGELGAARAEAIQMGVANAKNIVQAALPNLPPEMVAQLLAGFNRLNPAAIESLLGALGEGPLSELLQTFGKQAAMELGQAILDGVALGYNPRKVADRMVEILGGNLSRALTISRTEMLRAYRTANLANYAANGGIVKGWRWSCAFDHGTCLACMALDGKEFDVSDTFMPCHPNCRCAPEPITVSYRDLGLDVEELPARQTASEWLETLPESQQRGFFSKSAWRAYKDGAVTLDDFIGTQESNDWGKSFIEKSLKDILGENAGKYYLN